MSHYTDSEITKLKREIERLKERMGVDKYVIAELSLANAKLQAVVDGLCDMLEEVGVDSHSALAALETDDD